MGGEQSKSASSQGKMMNDTKKILLLHKSSETSQIKIVRYFKDALTTAANGSLRVIETVNIAKTNELSKDLSWLEEMNNLVLICLTPEAIEQLEKILRTKHFADESNLHGKIFTISFGDSLASQWPPKGMKKSTSHARDFFFGFSEVEKLKPNDFEKSEKMPALVAAIKGTIS